MIILDKYMKRSISKNEIVLNYDDAIRFIDDMSQNKIPIVSWDGWTKHKFSKLEKSEEFQGTSDCYQKSDEVWNIYVERANEFAKSTIISEMIRWNESREKNSLYFKFKIDRGIGCSICGELPNKFLISTPNDYYYFINRINALIDEGKLDLVNGNCKLDDIGVRKPWPDDFIYHVFRCKECYSEYEISVETYHGSGGMIQKKALTSYNTSFSDIPSDDTVLARQALRHFFR